MPPDQHGRIIGTYKDDAAMGHDRTDRAPPRWRSPVFGYSNAEYYSLKIHHLENG
jgi:hypothetical protein